MRFRGRFIRPNDLVGIGTSVTAIRPADGILLADTFIVKIGLALGYKVYQNSGISGDNTSDKLARWEPDVLQYYPGQVNWEIGPNDWSEAVPIATSEANIRAGVRKSQTQGSRFTLMVPILVRDAPSDAGVESWRELTRDLAGELNCELFDTYAHFAGLSGAELDTLYLPADPFHLSVAGHTRINDRAIADGVLTVP